jgi:nicotinamide mononucleotide transporter
MFFSMAKSKLLAGWNAMCVGYKKRCMGVNEWFNLLVTQLKQTTLLEWLVVAFGVTEVLLAKANKVALYPAGIIASSLSIFLLFNAQLYAECLLSFYYVGMSIYGWVLWTSKRDKPAIQISYSNTQNWIIAGAISIGGWFVLYTLLTRFTDTTVAGWDALVSSLAWAGTWLLSKRKIENWLLLNLSNLVAVPLLFYKQLPMFALLTIFLFIVAVFGFFDWKKIYKTHNKWAGKPVVELV